MASHVKQQREQPHIFLGGFAHKLVSGSAALCLMILLWSVPGTVLAAKSERQYTGIVTTIDAKEHILGTTGTFFDKQFNLSPECAYILYDRGNGSVTNLRLGENVTVDYQNVSGVLVASRVEAHPMRFEGTVDQVNTTNHSVTVYCDELDRTFDVPRNCQIFLLNNQAGAITNLHNNDHVLVTYVTPDQNLTALRIEQTHIQFTGTLKAIDLVNGTLKARERFHWKEFKLARNCAVVVGGKASRADALKPDDRLVFSYDVIHGVNVVNRIIPADEATSGLLMDEFSVDF